MHEIVSFSKDIEFKNMINKITSISLEHTLMLEDKSNIKGDFIVSGSYKMTAASQIENDFSYKIPVDIEVDDKYDLSNLVIDIDDFTYEVIDEEILRVNIDLLLDKLEVKEKLVFDEEKEEPKDELVVSEDLFMETDSRKELSIPLEPKKEEELEIIDSSQSFSSDKTSERHEEILDEVDEAFDKINNEVKINANNIDISPMNKELENNKELEKLNTQNQNSKEISNTNQTNNTNDQNNQMNHDNTTTKEDSSTPSLFSSFDSSNETYSTYSIYILRDGDSIENIINKYKTTREKIEEYNDLSDLRIGTKIIIPSTQSEWFTKYNKKE